MEKQKVSILIPMLSGIFLGIAIAFLIDSEEVGGIAAKSIIIGLVAALNTFFLQFCYHPGNIFGGYMEWVEKNFRDNPKNPFFFLYKPLGGCAYCQNIYIAFFYFLAINIVFGLTWWALLPTLFIAHLFLLILDLLFWQ